MMFGLIPRKVRLEFDASVESVEEALRQPHAGIRVRLEGKRFKIVHHPGLRQPASVMEGWLIDDGMKCVFDGTIRWSRSNQVFLAAILVFLSAFCFGIPALMVRSFLMGTMTSSVGHPLWIPLFWAVVTWLPFHFFLGVIFQSHLPQIEKRLGKIIHGESNG